MVLINDSNKLGCTQTYIWTYCTFVQCTLWWVLSSTSNPASIRISVISTASLPPPKCLLYFFQYQSFSRIWEASLHPCHFLNVFKKKQFCLIFKSCLDQEFLSNYLSWTSLATYSNTAECWTHNYNLLLKAEHMQTICDCLLSRR